MTLCFSKQEHRLDVDKCSKSILYLFFALADTKGLVFELDETLVLNKIVLCCSRAPTFADKADRNMEADRTFFFDFCPDLSFGLLSFKNVGLISSCSLNRPSILFQSVVYCEINSFSLP